MAARPGRLQAAHRLLFPGNAKDAEQLDEDPMRYDRYGMRVPAVLVSPYARRDCVLSEVFDHTSVLKLVEEKWNPPALTRRDAAAASPIGALDSARRPHSSRRRSCPGPAARGAPGNYLPGAPRSR